MADKWLRFFVVFLSLFSIWVVISNVRNVTTISKNNQSVVDSLIYLNDSLKNELFIEHTNVDRYEIALDRLREEDSISAQKFEDKLFNIE
jgi:hypothetical protein